MSTSTIMATVAGLSLSLCFGGAFAEERTLSGSEIKAWISGATLGGATSGGGDWRAKYDPDGTYTVEVLGSSWSDEGTWAVEGDTLCTERTKKARGCTSITHLGGNEYSTTDDRGQTTKMKKLE